MIKKIFVFGLLIILATVLIFVIYFFVMLNKHGVAEDEKEFIVRSGQSTREIANNLKKEGLISSSFVFSFYTKLKGEFIQVGVYKLSPQKKMTEISNILVQGETSADLVTIPEGWRATQVDDLLAEKNFIKAGEFTQIASADEGYLFPDTYRFSPDMKPQDIRREMLDNFEIKTATLNLTRENVILASIVEREAKFDEDRPKIAGVYLNRLEKNMKLEADPTIQYVKGNWEKITTADYKNVNSPYNTYLNNRLPPGPISNPGLKSIEAVVHPEKNGFLYFFHKSDGYAVYSQTAEEHALNLKNAQ